jgi:hypothetical protein
MSSSAVFGRGFESHSLQHIFCFWGFGSVWRCLRPSVGLAVLRVPSEGFGGDWRHVEEDKRGGNGRQLHCHIVRRG